MTACTMDMAPPEPWEGPPASWSAPVPSDMNTAVMIGRVLVVDTTDDVLGVDAETGKLLWSLPAGFFDVSGDLIVAFEPKGGSQDEVPTDGFMSVADPATGRVLWRKDPIDEIRVAEDAIFTLTCPAQCVITRHDRRSGEPRWSVRSDDEGLGVHGLGARGPFTPPIGPYLLTGTGGGGQKPSWGAVDTASGRLVRARTPDRDWYPIVVGRAVVAAADLDGPEERDRCSIPFTAFDAESGRERWKAEVFSGRASDGSCSNSLDDFGTGHRAFIGTGDRIAAVTENGHPQVFDLTAGRTVWRGKAKGVPIDGDGRTLLVRELVDQGGLALLDFATGRVLWTAPDPGPNAWTGEYWQTAVTDRLVAVGSAHTGLPETLVYRVEDGRLLGRFPGGIQGLGKDWVAVAHDFGHPDAERFQLEFIQL